MYPFRPEPIFRLRPAARDGGEPRGHPKQPHPPATVAEARKLVEATRLTFNAISRKVGVSCGTISRWAARHGWRRPLHCWPLRPHKARAAPEAHGRVLATRLRVQAERLLSQVERAPAVDPAALAEAVRLLADARAAQHARKRPRPAPVETPAEPDASSPKSRQGRVQSRESRSAAAGLGWRKRYSRREAHHAWMLEKIEE